MGDVRLDSFKAQVLCWDSSEPSGVGKESPECWDTHKTPNELLCSLLLLWLLIC